MELKFVVGMLIVAIGFALMLPLDEKDDTNNAPPQIAQQKIPERKKDFPVSARSYARSMVSVEEYVALHELIMRESSWNPDARNRKSTDQDALSKVQTDISGLASLYQKLANLGIKP